MPLQTNKWELKLHDDVEDPHYELTNGPISLVANCGFVGETEEDEDAIFKKVADTLNESGIDFCSNNKLELDQHIEIMRLQGERDQWKAKYDELKRNHEITNTEYSKLLEGYTALKQQHQQLKERAEKIIAPQQKLHEAVQHLFDVRKEKNKGNLVLNAWNSVANWLYDAKKSLSSWNEGKEITDKQRLARTVVAIAEHVSKDAESAEAYLESEGVDVEKVKDDAAYFAWKAKLIAVTESKTGSPFNGTINDEEARKWYESGATPYQCFRETWKSDGD